jgi:hypothetical protein
MYSAQNTPGHNGCVPYSALSGVKAPRRLAFGLRLKLALMISIG